ncbi:MAG TPA: hypothetical protein P5532_21200 [Planctomycetota bacterium]|nr:hypothetical protein [Planctomycetota bacterium]
MDTTGKSTWQQAAGDTDRDYGDLCLKWDVILNGPGYAGPWPDCVKRLGEDGWSARKLTILKRFCEQAKDGDLVVLRRGTSTVLAVGRIVGPYLWRDEFGDVDGWDLQHVRRVRWLWKHGGKPKEFPIYTLKQGDTTQRLNPGPVLDWLQSLQISEADLGRPLTDLPASSEPLKTALDDISEYLFDHGVASGSIAKLLDDIGELVRIAKWYQRSSKPSEGETVAYLVVPLLRALGWTPQRMAIEWNHVDLALFGSLPRQDDSLMVVVEAKKMDSSCLTAVSQAMSYASGKGTCRRLIVTDGLRYGVYTRQGSEEFGLYAYMNLTWLRREYPIYPCRGAREALLAMAPEWEVP